MMLFFFLKCINKLSISPEHILSGRINQFILVFLANN